MMMTIPTTAIWSMWLYYITGLHIHVFHSLIVKGIDWHQIPYQATMLFSVGFLAPIWIECTSINLFVKFTIISNYTWVSSEGKTILILDKIFTVFKGKQY